MFCCLNDCDHNHDDYTSLRDSKDVINYLQSFQKANNTKIAVYPRIVSFNTRKHKQNWDNQNSYTTVMNAISSITYNRNIIFWCEFSNSAADKTAHCNLVMFCDNKLTIFESLRSRYKEYQSQTKKKLPDGLKPIGLSKMLLLVIKTRVKVSFDISQIVFGDQKDNEFNCRENCANMLELWVRNKRQ